MSVSTHYNLLLIWSVVLVLETALAFTSSSASISRVSFDGLRRRLRTLPKPAAPTCFAKSPNESYDDIISRGDDSQQDDDYDWRAFRAKLVMSEGGGMITASSSSSPSSVGNNENPDNTSSMDDSDLDGFGALFSDNCAPSSSTLTPLTAAAPTIIPGFTPLEPSQWAYYSGKVIEQGAVILGGVEQDFGFGLRQQYFHKAVILVLDHDENTFTKGIILNRPSNKIMEDDVNEGLQWKVWFGGDVQGLDSLQPDIVCLHSLRSKEARNASVAVMKDIQVSHFPTHNPM
jgi:hypothetical protein